MAGMSRPLLVLFAFLSLVTGVVYPLVVTAIGHMLFPRQTAGSLVVEHGRLLGSVLISQSFEEPKYFWGRLSATAPTPNNPLASGGSNAGPLNPALLEPARARIAALVAADPDRSAPVPVDLITASASGLDPHISPAAALYQVRRVAAARHMSTDQLRQMVIAHVEPAQWGLLGEPRVNVLMLNLALDRRP